MSLLIIRKWQWLETDHQIWSLFGSFKIASRHIYQLAIEVMNIGDDDDDDASD